MKIILLLVILLCNYNSISQHLQYDIIVNSHNKPFTTTEIDTIFNELGYFNISDTLITKQTKGIKSKYIVNFKTLNLDCNCYYYFCKNNYIIVVYKQKLYILVTKLDLEIMYMKTYYIIEE
jgi:hypothetical protein